MFAIAMLTGAVQALSQDVNRDPTGPLDQTPMGGGECLAETLAKCLEDLRSDNPETRRAAVMLLGKYEHPDARAALKEALRDTVVAVRRASVVSLFENPNGAVGAAAALLPLIADEDVHIRRMVTARIPLIMGVALPGFAAPHVRVTIPAARLAAGPREAALLRMAFADPDERVRRNMLEAYPVVQSLVGPVVLPPLLREADPALRVQALQALRGSLPPAAVATQVLFLVDDPEPEVRAELARTCAAFKSPDSDAVLRTLAQDPVDAVASEAIRAGLLRGNLFGPEVAGAFLARDNPDPDSGVSVVQALARGGESSHPALREVLLHPRAEFRAAAAQILSRHQNGLDAVNVVALLNDPAFEVRRMAGMAVGMHGILDAEALGQLVESPFPDVRELVVRASRRLDREVVAGLLEDLLIDESPGVRHHVIREYAQRGLPGWIEVAGRALRDGSDEVRDAAHGVLRQRLPAGARPWIERAAERARDDAERLRMGALLEALDAASVARPPAGDATGMIGEEPGNE